MNLVLSRLHCRSDGIFGTLSSPNGVLAVTLEHAYPVMSTYIPKIPVGTYSCVRGLHKLEGMDRPFDTFEITGVPGHTNLLFHAGNYNRDSEGCVLLGTSMFSNDFQSWMIRESRLAFCKFLDLQSVVNEFTLRVI